MDIYGIIGTSLAHSFSPKYFNDYFQKAGISAKYLCFEIPKIQQLAEILHQYPQLKGFNVTIPYKESIFPLLDQISEEAIAVGAVNCVKIESLENHKKLIGYNTDIFGFQSALLDFIPPTCNKALILGNGGAAKAVRYVLNALHIPSLTVSRTPQTKHEISYIATKQYIPEYSLIINTTPLGTWPNTENAPNIAYDLLTPNHYLFDLVYNPSSTKFMKKGQLQGAHVCNGHQMLLKQAEKNLEIWRNKNHSLFSQTNL